MPDKNETWQATEEALTNLLSSSLGAEFDPNAVEKAHRLGGPYIREKTRPVIVKFASLKAKELVLARRSKLRSHKVSVSEDYCQATRTARKMLHNYAKSLPGRLAFQLRYDKLVVNHRNYCYDASAGIVRETTAHSRSNGSESRIENGAHSTSDHSHDLHARLLPDAALLSRARTSNASS